MSVPRLSDHGSEIGLLGLLGVGVLVLLALAVLKGVVGKHDGLDVAAFLLVLQRIVEAVQARWTQRSVDRMGQQLGGSAPAPDPPARTTIEGERP